MPNIRLLRLPRPPSRNPREDFEDLPSTAGLLGSLGLSFLAERCVEFESVSSFNLRTRSSTRLNVLTMFQTSSRPFRRGGSYLIWRDSSVISSAERSFFLPRPIAPPYYRRWQIPLPDTQVRQCPKIQFPRSIIASTSTLLFWPASVICRQPQAPPALHLAASTQRSATFMGIVEAYLSPNVRE